MLHICFEIFVYNDSLGFIRMNYKCKLLDDLVGLGLISWNTCFTGNIPNHLKYLLHLSFTIPEEFTTETGVLTNIYYKLVNRALSTHAARLKFFLSAVDV